MKVILIHRWSGNPDSDWYQSVSNSLKEEGFRVEIPEMPNTDEPKISEWVGKLKEICPSPDKETLFIGHSIGCQAILRYLEQLDNKIKVGRVLFVAPWFNLQGLESEPKSSNIAKPWIENSIDLEKVKAHLTSITTIFSDNDPYVSLSDKEVFKQILGSKVIVEHNKGHFTSEDNITNMQIVVNELIL
jgi:predicted alpha/beta hydrolase family esterase